MVVSVVSNDPAILEGVAVFQGTRVPVQALIDYLDAGKTVDVFLEDFPSVPRTTVVQFLYEAKETYVQQALETA